MKRVSRLGRGADLDLLMRRGRRVSHPWFSVVWRPNGGHASRFAFIVPRATDKRAVVRNRLRRRMREFMRARAASFSAPMDIAITCRRGARESSRAAFYEVLQELVEHLGKK